MVPLVSHVFVMPFEARAHVSSVHRTVDRGLERLRCARSGNDAQLRADTRGDSVRRAALAGSDADSPRCIAADPDSLLASPLSVFASAACRDRTIDRSV